MRQPLRTTALFLGVGIIGGYLYGEYVSEKEILATERTTETREIQISYPESKGLGETEELEGDYVNEYTLGARISRGERRPQESRTGSGEVQESLGSGEGARQTTTGGAKERSEAVRSEANGNPDTGRLDDGRAYGYLGSFSITAYTAGYESTQKKKGEAGYGITATGTTVKEGRTIAADWSVLPPGTVVQIEGLEGTYTVEDRGGGVKGQHIDLYFDSLGQAKEWGRQQRSVWVINWGLSK